jgi:hypothetical protein
MPSLSGSNVLIVGEAPGTLDLRERLIDSGANVQVVSVAGASIIMRQKQIDSAFIAASLDQETQQHTEPLQAAMAKGVGLNGLRRRFRTPALPSEKPA